MCMGVCVLTWSIFVLIPVVPIASSAPRKQVSLFLACDILSQPRVPFLPLPEAFPLVRSNLDLEGLAEVTMLGTHPALKHHLIPLIVAIHKESIFPRCRMFVSARCLHSDLFLKGAPHLPLKFFVPLAHHSSMLQVTVGCSDWSFNNCSFHLPWIL